MPPLPPEEFSSTYETDLKLTELAFKNLEERKVFIVSVSGKLGSGKDSVAPKVMDELTSSERSHEFFAKKLKDEVTHVIALIKSSENADAASRLVEAQLTIPLKQAKLVVERLWEDVKSGLVSDSYTRTDNTRFALQYWGTEVRRSQDEKYWVKRTVGPAVEKLAAGVSVFLTDARFENEVDSLSHLGAHTVRLRVSLENQRARIIARDGIAPTAEALGHSSENALDGYEKDGLFSAVIDTDALELSEVVAAVLESIESEGATV